MVPFLDCFLCAYHCVSVKAIDIADSAEATARKTHEGDSLCSRYCDSLGVWISCRVSGTAFWYRFFMLVTAVLDNGLFLLAKFVIAGLNVDLSSIK